jgi:hypothetical protein
VGTWALLLSERCEHRSFVKTLSSVWRSRVVGTKMSQKKQENKLCMERALKEIS